MSTEWIQIIIVCAIYAVLVIATGKYLRWRRWDMERREMRMAKLSGLREFYNGEVAWLEFTPPPWGEKDGIYQWPQNPGFSVKA